VLEMTIVTAQTVLEIRGKENARGYRSPDLLG